MGLRINYFTNSVDLTADKTIYAQRKKKANDKTEYCIEPVIEIRTPKTNMPKTIANFSVTS
jgi:hypothetical protein